MINSLRSSDQNEARLAGRLTNIYNSSILSNKQLDIAVVHGEIVQFWAQIREARQLMSSSEDTKEALNRYNTQVFMHIPSTHADVGPKCFCSCRAHR